METREILLIRLDNTLAQFLETIESLADPTQVIYDDWSAKDILGHITFWHESFARNVRDLAEGVKPTLLKGRLIEINQRAVAEMASCSLEQVAARLRDAQRVIQENIFSPKLTRIPYRKGSREYTPEEHLELVDGHIQQHLYSIQKRVKASRPQRVRERG